MPCVFLLHRTGSCSILAFLVDPDIRHWNSFGYLRKYKVIGFRICTPNFSKLELY